MGFDVMDSESKGWKEVAFPHGGVRVLDASTVEVKFISNKQS